MVDLAFAPVESAVADNLEAVPHFGGSGMDEPEDGLGEFRVRVHESPIALSFKDLFTREKAAITAKLYDRFDLWLVPHRFSVFRTGGAATVTTVGCEVDYITEGQTLSIISLIPSAETVDRVDASLAAEAKANISLSDMGLIVLASSALNGGGLFSLPGSPSTSASVKISGGVKINLSMNVVTPYISAVGAGSTSCIFQFTAHRQALFNRDLETWAVVALPEREEELAYKMRCSFTSRRLFVPRLWQTPWSELRVTKGS